MARRKRLSPATLTDMETGAVPVAGPRSAGRPPIASVVADAAGQAALGEVVAEYAAARAGGRLVVELPLDAVEATHLVRDRLVADDTDLAALKESIAARGQQTPVEVEDLGQGRYGLISGWRRLLALRQLFTETGDPRFATIQALLRCPETASEAYVAMVEENEIRANLGYWERARIAHLAAERGVFPTAEKAVRELFRHASRPKRSKILSFLRLFRALDGVLRFPSALTERQGLALAKRIEEDPDTISRLKTALKQASPGSPEEEAKLIEAATRPRPAVSRQAKAAPTLTEHEAPRWFRLKAAPGRVELTGRGVDETFLADLKTWLAARSRH